MNNPQLQELIRPKTFLPALSSNYVHRARLQQELKAQQNCPLIVISGPAGYGKTTLLSAWLADIEWPVVWVSLDQEDNNLHLFVRYVVAAIQDHFPRAMKKTAALLHSIMPPDEMVLGRTLINELDHIDSPFVIALDDYHLISEKAIHRLIGQIVRYPPRTLHMVIATRHDPPLPLSTLQAQGKLAVIRTDALRFTEEESTTMLERVSGMALSASTAAILIEQLDGWAAGLHVAGLTLRHKPATLALKPSSITTHFGVMEYLFDEVLQQQPAQVQDFLIRTSILDELNQPLCDAVMGQGLVKWDGEPCLSYHVQRNLFISSVNEEEGIYRYHHLFQKLLRAQLMERCSAEEIMALHERASDWYAGHGQPDEALRYALRVKDYARVVQIISRYRHQMMNDDQWQRLDRLIYQLPREILNASPDLLLTEASIALVSFRGREIQNQIVLADQLIAGMTPSAEREALRGEVAGLRAQLHFDHSDMNSCMAAAELALRLTPHNRWNSRTPAWLYSCVAQAIEGNRAMAYEQLYSGFTEERDEGDGFRLRLMVLLGLLHTVTGDLAGQVQIGLEILERYGSSKSPTDFIKWSHHQNWAHYFLGMAHYHRNELAQAEATLLTLIEHRYQCYLHCAIQGMFMLALTHQAQGRPDTANRLADMAAQHVLEMRGTPLVPVVDAFKANLALQQGRVSDAYQRVGQLNLPETLSPLWAFYSPYLTFSKVQLAVGTPESLAKAEVMLEKLHAHVERQHMPRARIEVLAQEALLADAKHDQRTALMRLELALVMAESQGYIRLFADLGSRMGDMLALLHSRSVSPSYVQRIMDAFRTHDAIESLRAQARLIEPLTNRELEVLEQLSKRMSSKEIADSLYISPGTVKRHVHSIYQKLDVSRRRDAVIKALDLKLLNYQ